MPYFLSYVVNKNVKDKYFLGHASLVLTEHTPPAKPRIICKVGLFESNQVELEDKMYRPEKGYTFQHKTYPITQEEMTKFLYKVNSDRRMGIYTDPKRKRSSEMTIKRSSGELESTPGGPEFDYWRLNCKTYALSVLREVGIVDSSLSNWLIDIPNRSGALHDLEFETTQEGRFWISSLVVSKRVKSQTLEGSTPEEIEEMNVTIMTNEYLNAFKDLTRLVENPHLNAVKGIGHFRETIKNIHHDLASLEPSKELLNGIQVRTQAAIKNFEKYMRHQTYGLGLRLIDTVKHIANYLSGKQYALSPRYKAEQMLHSYKRQIKYTAAVRHPHYHTHHHHREKRKIKPQK